MKRILLSCFVVLFSANLIAAKSYYDAEIYFKDGTSKTGMAALIEDGEEKHIKFKPAKGAKAEKIESAQLTRIVYNIGGETYEYEQLKIFKGWGQKRIGGPLWLQVVEKGIVTLYVNQTVLYGRNRLNSAGFQDYYCIRAGEPAAKWISAVSSMNNNAHFKANAPDYFEDYAELSAKIKSKEYKWDDIITVVKAYNIWAKK